MVFYDSAIPTRGNVQDGDSEYPENTALVIAGGDGSNYQQLLVDPSGRPNMVGAAADGTPTAGNPLLVAGADASGNVQTLATDTNGRLAVVIGGGVRNSVTYANATLVKDTPTSVVSLAGTTPAREVIKIMVSGSGLMKVELKEGATGLETTKAVKFNSTANPNVEFEFKDGYNISTGNTIRIECTNLENRASPASDFNGYGTIITQEAA